MSSREEFSSEDEIYSCGDSQDEEDSDVVSIDSEENECLPVLFNGSSRRPKTIDNYIAPDKLRNCVYRCQEFPHGVYINVYGEVCPDDRRSGIYQVKSNSSSNQKPEEPFVPDDVSTDDSYVDEPDETDSDEEHFPSDMESEINDVVFHKRKIHDEDAWSEDEEGTVCKKSKTSDYSSKSPDTHLLTKEEKQNEFLRDLKQAADDSDVHYSRYKNSKKRNLHVAKMLNSTNKLAEDWFKLKNTSGAAFVMAYESQLLIEEPKFSMVFHRKKQPNESVQANFNCVNFQVECSCSFSCGKMSRLVEHLNNHH